MNNTVEKIHYFVFLNKRHPHMMAKEFYENRIVYVKIMNLAEYLLDEEQDRICLFGLPLSDVSKEQIVLLEKGYTRIPKLEGSL